MKVKKHVLFVISDDPIDLPKNAARADHLISEQVELEANYAGGGEWKVRMETQGGYAVGEGISQSMAITDALKDLTLGMGYVPLYKQKQEIEEI
ncbi:hypothetical protein A2755_02925 [Candidatus Wolfebacteria bacterium RIFCSPHIGHO2_01_FULL_48_22]|uniref:Uncharacterized protein n=2 Tax=Candidatus Wolfeibacteriota TaxID=1752735 RepID=A0A1F8DRS0_9BACT|nr:MAG: hypothetical protein A2755_02925 [Candidatus Wolfebacteria bacterium RIFCSPHIGHO2_01_FULL_48_22]OGM92181.1 MAG: hypothetical protein A2935_00140 [Candidatus Wolfebacteria bacterium RIFCSPLOWO2_01_FULL_47_17b]